MSRSLDTVFVFVPTVFCFPDLTLPEVNKKLSRIIKSLSPKFGYLEVIGWVYSFHREYSYVSSFISNCDNKAPVQKSMLLEHISSLTKIP